LQLITLDISRQPLTVGRRKGMDILIAWDPQVSALHAELRCPGGEWTVADDGLSTNGTFVNGQRVAGSRRLRDGDRVRVGTTVMAFNAPARAAVDETATAGSPLAVAQITDAQRRVLVALCRPYKHGGAFATPATNQHIADELFLSVDAVKMHLRVMFAQFELNDLPQNQKRARLVECLLQTGLITPRDL
jgi:predicted component of type VI protein secretion system